jgi:hypothetical protein
MHRSGIRPLPRRLLLLGLVLLLPLLVQGCWTLESYVARVRIEADGGYTYFLEGSAMHTETAFALRRADYAGRTGKARPEDVKKMKEDAEANLAKDLESVRKDPRVQSVKSVGGGRVRFALAGKGGIAGGEIIFQGRDAPLAYAQGPGGTLNLRLKDAVVGRNAEALGIKVNGDVSMTLAKGIEVLEHNAEKAPTVPGGAYRWHIGNPSGPAPRLLIRLPKQ